MQVTACRVSMPIHSPARVTNVSFESSAELDLHDLQTSSHPRPVPGPRDSPPPDPGQRTIPRDSEAASERTLIFFVLRRVHAENLLAWRGRHDADRDPMASTDLCDNGRGSDGAGRELGQKRVWESTRAWGGREERAAAERCVLIETNSESLSLSSSSPSHHRPSRSRSLMQIHN